MRVEILPVHRDARGGVFEPLAGGEIARHRNAHVVLTEPGAVRGNHLHPRGTEVLTVVGPALVRTRDGGEVTDTEVPAGEAFRFTFPPGVAHAVRNTGTAPIVLVSFNTVAHDPADPDVVRDVLIEG
ncbi:MAG TPA: cupin domain-containing protein [Longimicrobiaceae bacterium]|nr:cupin domain-containing protein [Longimicrobiaceae bacterium]